MAAFGRREHEIRKYLNLPDPDWHGLILADVGHHIVPALQADLQETDDAIVLELFTDGTDQYWAHITSRPETGSAVGGRKEPGIITVCPSIVYPLGPRSRPDLDGHVFCPQNDAVIPLTGRVADQTTRTILIVDDDRSVADTFARMLKLEGFGVATALSAEAGLELADSVRPNAIILDMRMPITNGLQFLRLVRSKPHLVDVPVAIVTGDYFLPDSIQHELKSLGASIRFKPLWLEDLIALAKTLVSA